MADAFQEKRLALKGNGKLSQYYYTKTSAFQLIEAGTRFPFPTEEMHELARTVATSTGGVKYWTSSPLFTLSDGTEFYLGLQRGYGSSKALQITVKIVKGENTTVSLTAIGLGRYDSTHSFAQRLYTGSFIEWGQLYVYFRYDNVYDNSCFCVAEEGWFVTPSYNYDDFVYSVSSSWYGLGIQGIYGNITTEDSLYDIIQQMFDDNDWDEINDPETGEDSNNGGGDGTYEYNTQYSDFPDADQDVCSPLDTGMMSLYQLAGKNQVKSLAQYLWSSDFIDSIIKLQSDPMANIISLYTLPFSVSSSFEDNLYVGNVNTNVTCHEIKRAQHEIDVGTIHIPKYFGNAFDYAGRCQIYLPYIGFKEIQLDVIRGGSIHLKYRYDATNGNILALLKCKQESKFDMNSVNYVFEGNCATQIPLSASNHARQWGALAQTVLSGATGGVGGLASSALGNAEAMLSPSYQRSGSLASCFGNMGQLKPYVIIEDPKPYIPKGAKNQYGGASNQRAKLNTLTGYQKFRYVRLDDLTYLDNDEKQQLLDILKEGVFL